MGEREIEERQREGGEMERERERERDLVSKFYVEVENYSQWRVQDLKEGGARPITREARAQKI